MAAFVLDRRKDSLVHKASKRVEEIRSKLWSLSKDDILELKNGTFIYNLEYGPLSYLHKIFSGCSKDDIVFIQKLIGFRLPSDYMEFLEFCNGCTLFDNTLFIYGANSRIERSISLEDQVAESLERVLDNLKQSGKLHPNSHWVPVGAVAAYDKSFGIELSQNGASRLTSSSGSSAVFGGFIDCLDFLVALLERFCGVGRMSDSRARQLQLELNRIVAPDQSSH